MAATNKFPINAPPVISGSAGKAWLVDLAELRRNVGTRIDELTEYWVIEAPGAHPFWHSYALVLGNLRPAPGREVFTFLPGASHEVHLYACTPQADLNKLLAGRHVNAIMHPANFLAQIIALTDDDARKRVRDSVEKVCSGALNPDTDGRWQWIETYGDAMWSALTSRAGLTVH